MADELTILSALDRENSRRLWFMKGDTYWLPDWVNEQAWRDFEAHRKDIKKPLTDRARRLSIKRLEGLTKEQQQKTIDRSIECRWVGLFPEKKDDSRNWVRRQKIYQEPAIKPQSHTIAKQERVTRQQWQENKEVGRRHIAGLRMALKGRT